MAVVGEFARNPGQIEVDKIIQPTLGRLCQMKLVIFRRDPPMKDDHFHRTNHYTSWETSPHSNKR